MQIHNSVVGMTTGKVQVKMDPQLKRLIKYPLSILCDHKYIKNLNEMIMSTFYNYQTNRMKQVTNYTEKGILKLSCCLFYNLKDNFPPFFVKTQLK